METNLRWYKSRSETAITKNAIKDATKAVIFLKSDWEGHRGWHKCPKMGRWLHILPLINFYGIILKGLVYIKNIILVGFKSAGKTTWAKKIALRLGWPWVDTDDFFSPSPSIAYQEMGKLAFRAKEGDYLGSLLSVSQHVIATGGGAADAPENQAILRQLGMVIHLKTPRAIIQKRLQESPVCFQGESFETLYDRRVLVYDSIAHYTVTCENELWEVIRSLSNP